MEAVVIRFFVVVHFHLVVVVICRSVSWTWASATILDPGPVVGSSYELSPCRWQ